MKQDELPNRIAGTMDCQRSGVYVLRLMEIETTWKFTSKTFEKKREQFSSTEPPCDEGS